MNPDLLRLLLGRSFAPEATAAPARGQRPPSAAVAIEPGTSEPVRRVLTSPTADSLYTLFGTPTRGGDVYERDLGSTAGMYERDANRIRLNPYDSQPMVDEFGGTSGTYFTDINKPGHSSMGSPRMTLAHEVGHLAAPTGGEAAANARAQAFEFLSTMGTNANASSATLDAMERAHPGTRQIVGSLLKDKTKQQQLKQIKGRMEDVLKNLIVPRGED